MTSPYRNDYEAALAKHGGGGRHQVLEARVAELAAANQRYEHDTVRDIIDGIKRAV